MTDKLNLRRVEITGSSESDFLFDEEVYFTGRITVNQVTKHMRDNDGLLPGQIVSSHEVDSLPELSWLIGGEQRDLPQYIIHSMNNDSLDSFLTNAEHFGFDDLDSKKADVKKWQERALHTREQGGWFKKSK